MGKMFKLHTDRPELNLGPWCYEAAVLTTVPPCRPVAGSLVLYEDDFDFDLLLSHVLIYSEKYCFLHAIQTKHTVHREGNKRVQNVVLQS